MRSECRLESTLATSRPFFTHPCIGYGFRLDSRSGKRDAAGIGRSPSLRAELSSPPRLSTRSSLGPPDQRKLRRASRSPSGAERSSTSSNRTRFPDFQEMAGSFNSKRAYFGNSFAERAGINSWRSETHVIAALWSSEFLHALRLRTSSFRGLCPDGSAAFDDWWRGVRANTGKSSTLVVLDPAATGKQRAFVDLDGSLTARPRYRGYSDAVTTLARSGSTSAASSSG